MGGYCAVIYTEKRGEARKAAEYAKSFLEKRGFSIELRSANQIIGEKLPKVDLAIAFGGDGTFLKTVKALPDPAIPVLGVNFGRGGFLIEAEAFMLDEALNRVVKGDYELEKAMMISVRVEGGELGDILNEVYIASQVLGEVLKARVMKDDVEIMRIEADGVIVSTPIGSTAYAYSAGGPIVDDDLEAAVIAAVCPISNFRPMVLSLEQELSVEVISDHGISVMMDGFIKKNFDERVLRLAFRKSSRAATFVRLGLGENFARRVRKKLG